MTVGLSKTIKKDVKEVLLAHSRPNADISDPRLELLTIADTRKLAADHVTFDDIIKGDINEDDINKDDINKDDTNDEEVADQKDQFQRDPKTTIISSPSIRLLKGSDIESLATGPTTFEERTTVQSLPAIQSLERDHWRVLSYLVGKNSIKQYDSAMAGYRRMS
ncbi:hypothetical protein CAC42_3666 [Sphaceloma murrayae]|uniref:Uncharacterized protein n=1 Tax=Sphaceloma murrayae TaxID=2082308 RepID=A0A2K1QPS1_9PEZI|nr:hypothetical protein CAC42_3666 [Sphaceloma murrayae]